MAASVASISALIGRASSSGLALEEPFNVLDQRSSRCGVSGCTNKQRPAAALGRRRAADPSSPAVLGIVLLCSGSSRLSSRTGFVGVSATKQTRNRNPILDLDVNKNDEEEDDDDLDNEATEFAGMEEWTRNKPAGFGLTEYDTSLEDRLLAEIDAEKKRAQAAKAARKKAKKPVKTIEKQDALPQGVEVYVGNLPRKRNVDRDLRAAFRSARGLLHIRPIVDGNEKTREPMCKGLAFLTFASDNDAKAFINRYNEEEVKFGKMEKKVVCEFAASNSPFKKQLLQKQGPDSPRLQVRDTASRSSSPSASLSSHMAVDLGKTRELSAAESNLSDKPSIKSSDDLEGEDEEIDSLDISEDDLAELEADIWAELEDEDDFELERELEGDYDEDLNAGDACKAQNGEDLGQVETYTDPIHASKAVDDAIVEEADIQEAGSSHGRGFGLTPDDAAEEKDKKIQQLESKLKQLQVQLAKRQTKAKTSLSEERIEALEKRLLARARSASEKDSKISSANRATGSQKPSSKVKTLSKRPKLGGASRLKKKEKQIYIGVRSKYSTSEKEVAL